MTYRDPDPARVAETEAKLAADENIERAAAAGRSARAAHEHGIEKRLLRDRRSVATGAAIWGSAMAAYMAMIVAVGTTVATALGAGVAVGTISLGGATAIDRWRRRREQTWLSTLPFRIEGYVELLHTPLVVTAITAHVELESVEADDRERVVDLLGALETVDPVVKIDGTTIVIEMLLAGPVKKFARSLVEKVVTPLHDARKVVALHLAPSTADPATPLDLYR